MNESRGLAAFPANIFDLLVEQAKDYALFLLDPSGRIASWNLGAQRMKGYFADEIIGRHFSTFYPKDALDAKWPEFELKMAAQEGRFEDEGWRIRKDGSRFWAGVTITALRAEDGSLLGFSKITRDLTDKKMHEESLRQSEERFRLLVEGVLDYAIYMLDPEGRIDSWNAGAQRISSYTKDEMLGMHFSRFYTEEDIDAGKPWNALAVARQTGRCESEGWRVRKSGSRFWARTVVSAIHDAEGHLIGFASLTQDLTERRHVQDLQLAAKNVHEFIATLAHELRNPLAPIRSTIALLKAEEGDAAERALHYAVIDRQSAHLNRIVEDMVDIARISEGAIVVRRQPVTMSGIVEQAVEAAWPRIQAKSHRLAVECEPEIFVDADCGRIVQAVTNLLTNAARYTQDGGQIRLSCAREERNVVLRVRDNGRGIEAKDLSRIFDMFVQGKPIAERVEAGIGVGLALSRRIAELHGGTLTAHSEGSGTGAEFVLTLPLCERSSPSVAAQTPGALQPVAHARRVLVVDDNADAGESLAMLLNATGHDSHVVFGGVDALEACRVFHPEVVLLDIGMPGMDGYEAAVRLREIAPGLRIIALTGWSEAQPADRQRWKDAGLDMHLMKPVDLVELMKAIG